MNIKQGLIAVTAALVVAGVAAPCCLPSAAAAEARAEQASRTTLRVEGMTCGACATSVKIVLRKLDGVRTADVSYAKKQAVVTYDGAKVTPQQMVKAIQDALPYKASVEQVEK